MIVKRLFVGVIIVFLLFISTSVYSQAKSSMPQTDLERYINNLQHVLLEKMETFHHEIVNHKKIVRGQEREFYQEISTTKKQNVIAHQEQYLISLSETKEQLLEQELGTYTNKKGQEIQESIEVEVTDFLAELLDEKN